MKYVPIVLVLLACVFLTLPAIADREDEMQARIARTQALIDEAGLDYTVGVTSMSPLTAEEFKRSLNLLIAFPDDMDTSWQQQLPIPADMPAHLDWRDNNGANWMTPVKDQHPCGTCATFSSLGAAEALIKIVLDNPFIVPDVSEEHAYACEGMMPYTFFHPLGYLKNSGVPDEACFPYNCQFTGDQKPCEDTCADWQNRIAKSLDHHMMMFPQPETIKAALQNGPIVAGMQVYDGFQDYTGGVYDEPGIVPLGGHGVVVLGYDDAEQYWICKNSWGPSWGEDGYFRIRWGQGLLPFGYQSFSIEMTYETICGGNVAPTVDALELLNAASVLDANEGLEIVFDWADINANLAGAELWYAIDEGTEERYAEPLVELTGTSSAAKDAVVFDIAGPFGPGEHSLAVWVRDLCGLDSNVLIETFVVEGGETDDDIGGDDDEDGPVMDDDEDGPVMDDDEADDDEDNAEDDDDDDSGCGC